MESKDFDSIPEENLWKQYKKIKIQNLENILF